MAYPVVWLPEAVNDLDGIAEYIAVDSRAYASSFVRRILHNARRLSEFPLQGRIVPEWDDSSIRQCVVSSYRLIYRVCSAQIIILAVIHGARMLPDEVRHR